MNSNRGTSANGMQSVPGKRLRTDGVKRTEEECR